LDVKLMPRLPATTSIPPELRTSSPRTVEITSRLLPAMGVEPVTVRLSL
jgi:hypothetical protein